MDFRRLAQLAISAAVMSGISSVSAATLANSSGIVNPAYTQTFESPVLANNTPLSNQFFQVYSTGPTTLYYDGNSLGGGACAFFEEAGNCISNFTTSASAFGVPFNLSPTFSIYFSSVQTYAAIALLTGGRDVETFTAFLHGVQVDQFTATTNSIYPQNATPGPGIGNYFGFTGEPGFDQIMISTTGSQLAVIDNIQFSNTPEPGTIALLGLGIGGFVVLARRRRSA